MFRCSSREDRSTNVQRVNQPVGKSSEENDENKKQTYNEEVLRHENLLDSNPKDEMNDQEERIRRPVKSISAEHFSLSLSRG